MDLVTVEFFARGLCEGILSGEVLTGGFGGGILMVGFCPVGFSLFFCCNIHRL